jgi:hypothetical protein
MNAHVCPDPELVTIAIPWLLAALPDSLSARMPRRRAAVR